MQEEKLTAREEQIIADVAKAMVDRRHELGLSQRAFAEQCGFSHSAIARLESGKQMPNLTTFIKLLTALELDINLVPSDQSE